MPCFTGLFGDTKTALIVVQLIGYSIVGLVYRALYMMRKTAKESTPAGMYSAIGLGVLLVVLGVLSLAGLMNEGFTLAVLVNCVATVLLGVTVFMYCGAMKKLQRIWNLDYANRKSDFFTPDRGTTSTNVILDGQTSAPTNEYIPTWKRIQMEHGQQTHVERPYVKAAVTVKICPECGTTQSADNHECICCGATM